MTEDSLIGFLTKLLFGTDPHAVSWPHVLIALLLCLSLAGPPWAKVYWHIRRERFLQSATPEQAEAYRSNPPSPPSLGGPTVLLLLLLGAGLLLGTYGEDQYAEEAKPKNCSGGCPSGQTCNTRTGSCEAMARQPSPPAREQPKAPRYFQSNPVLLRLTRRSPQAEYLPPSYWAPAALPGSWAFHPDS